MSNNHILPKLGRVLNVDSAGTPMFTKQISSFTVSVGGNAMTITLPATVIEFRATTGSNGTPNVRTVPSNITLTIPAGATLGTSNGVMSRLTVLAIDNSGTVELAVINVAGDFNLDETSLITTNLIGAGSGLATTVYSGNVRSNVPFRVLGFIDSTQATAGQWASTPTLVQGVTSHNPLSLINVSLVGMCAHFAMQAPPAGWLRADGSAISRTTYAALFARIGATFGAGNGSTTFNVPDLRGEFIRGWDNGRGIDAGRGFGTFQSDLYGSHNHVINISDPGHYHYALSAIINTSSDVGTLGGSYGFIGGYNYGTSGYYVTGASGNTFLSTATTGITASSNFSGGTETRPRNYSMLACIKY